MTRLVVPFPCDSGELAYFDYARPLTENDAERLGAMLKTLVVPLLIEEQA